MQVVKSNNYRSRFDPQSPRAIRGLAFQSSVESSLSPLFQRTWNSRDWLLLHDKCLSDIQLNFQSIKLKSLTELTNTIVLVGTMNKDSFTQRYGIVMQKNFQWQ